MQAKIGAIFFFKSFTITSQYFYNMAKGFIKVELTDHLGSPSNNS